MGSRGASSQGLGGAKYAAPAKRYYEMPTAEMPDETATREGRTLMAQNGIVDFQHKGIVLRKVVTDGVETVAPLYYDQLKWLTRYGWPTNKAPTSAAQAQRWIDKAMAQAAKVRTRPKARKV